VFARRPRDCTRSTRRWLKLCDGTRPLVFTGRRLHPADSREHRPPRQRRGRGGRRADDPGPRGRARRPGLICATTGTAFYGGAAAARASFVRTDAALRIADHTNHRPYNTPSSPAQGRAPPPDHESLARQPARQPVTLAVAAGHARSLPGLLQQPPPTRPCTTPTEPESNRRALGGHGQLHLPGRRHVHKAHSQPRGRGPWAPK